MQEFAVKLVLCIGKKFPKLSTTTRCETCIIIWRKRAYDTGITIQREDKEVFFCEIGKIGEIDETRTK